MLRIDNVSYRIGSKQILSDITTTFAPGLLHVIVGPNGSGKSTFLKIFSGELMPDTGVVFYDDIRVAHGNKILLARHRAVMSQLPELHFPLSVEDIVLMGRYPHFNFQPSKKDTAICRQAMERVEIMSLSGRDYLTLSGGEKQRVQFARALAQIWEPTGSLAESLSSDGHSSTPASQPADLLPSRFLFLDEPVSSLDIHYQHQFLQIARSLVKENIILVAVLHDINLAMQYADRILFMKEGRIAAEGSSPGIVTADLIREVFNIPVQLLENPHGAAPVMVYTGSAR